MLCRRLVRVGASANAMIVTRTVILSNPYASTMPQNVFRAFPNLNAAELTQSRCMSKKAKKGKQQQESSDDDEEVVVEEEFDLKVVEDGMSKGINWLQSEFAKIRLGRATPDMLNEIKFDLGGGKVVGIQAIGSVRSENPQTLLLTIFETSAAEKVQNTLRAANLGLAVAVDPTGRIRLTAAKPTKESRDEAVKNAQKLVEQAKVAIRQARQKGQQQLKKLKKSLAEDEMKHNEDKLQKLLDSYTAKATEALTKKEADLKKI
eukprot:c1700_g1_i1.p1 GENE.c1700_g1_i1~~c1700_g1_i1.p1  ORF type:complete len:262 (-),score=82.45 c1700_g1_i1:126-911(-)